MKSRIIITILMTLEANSVLAEEMKCPEYLEYCSINIDTLKPGCEGGGPINPTLNPQPMDTGPVKLQSQDCVLKNKFVTPGAGNGTPIIANGHITVDEDFSAALRSNKMIMEQQLQLKFREK